jgi:hypothetical protein
MPWPRPSAGAAGVRPATAARLRLGVGGVRRRGGHRGPDPVDPVALRSCGHSVGAVAERQVAAFPIQPPVCVAGRVPGGPCGKQVLDLRDGQRNHAGVGRCGLIGGDRRRRLVSVRWRSKAPVTAQIASAAMTSTMWRAIAVYRRTWDWSRPKKHARDTGAVELRRSASASLIASRAGFGQISAAGAARLSHVSPALRLTRQLM